MNDTDLKQALAKMLPNELAFGSHWWEKTTLCYIPRLNGMRPRPVLDTELLHLCWMVEENIKLKNGCMPTEWYIQLRLASQDNEEHATWQQRTIALAKVLNIEIV